MALTDPLNQAIDTVQNVLLPAPTFDDKIQTIVAQYPAVPKVIIVPAAFLATLAGWGMLMWLAVHMIVLLEVVTEWRVYRTKYNLTAREWTSKITSKLIGYIALSLLAAALSWIAVEIRDASKLDIPQWVFMLTPNGAGMWIIFAAAQVIKDNIKLLGVPLPGIMTNKIVK